MSKWDKGLDYESMYRLLVNWIKRKKRGKCYASILLVQLRNGARISEAVRAFKEFLRTGKTEVRVPVSKKKKVETRLMVIPSEVVDVSRECVDYLLVEDSVLKNRVRYWALYNLKVNTHSLRYAFITYLLKMGVNPALIARAIGHSTLEHILTYTQEKEAERVLRDSG